MIKSTWKFAGLFIVGPLGCYLAYQLLFVFSFLDGTQYLSVTNIYQHGGYIIEAILACLVFGGVYKIAPPVNNYDVFTSNRKNLPVPTLCLMTSIVFSLIVSTIYRVLGTLNFEYFLENFDLYYMENTVGMAWMILLCYTIIYAILIDMYLAGANRTNAFFLFINILIVSMNGGRGLLILFALTFLILLLFQKVSWKNFIAASVASIVTIGGSYSVITYLRSPVEQAPVAKKIVAGKKPKKIKRTDSFYDLNYNAAFILDDVIKKMDSGKTTPRVYMLEDVETTFIPRAIFPDKPKSTAETREIYPEVANRGTNITFPLKANIMLHLGRWSFYTDWVVVFIAQFLLFVGLKRRFYSPGIAGFVMVMTGGSFSLLARGGVFNARLLVQVVCILAAYCGYLILKMLSDWCTQRAQNSFVIRLLDGKVDVKNSL